MPHPRLLTNVFLFLAVFMAPWWVAALIALIALVAFEHFYEALAAGIVMDALYSMPTPGTWSFVFFVGAAVALLLLELAKTRMRVFERW
jgi:hypothetical protein